MFLTECADFGEAQVVKSFLVSQGFHPKVRDEQMRTVAPHLQNLLGKLVIEIPEVEFMSASEALEGLEKQRLEIVRPEDHDEQAAALAITQGTAKRSLINAVLGCVFIPVLCNLYSMFLTWKVLAEERPLSRISRTRIALATIFNILGFYFWLTFGLKHFLQNM